jgi:hypothetical protein
MVAVTVRGPYVKYSSEPVAPGSTVSYTTPLTTLLPESETARAEPVTNARPVG